MYSEELTDCNGSDLSVIADLTCTIPSASFTLTPFNLAWGSSIHSIIIATNVRGDSVASDSGNGAIIYTNPDTPLNLQNDPLVTMGNQIGLTWEAGLADGGTPVIDYKLSYAKISEDYATLDSGLLGLSYTAQNLESGTTYKFKI